MAEELGTAVACEGLFSDGADVLPILRHHLDDCMYRGYALIMNNALRLLVLLAALLSGCAGAPDYHQATVGCTATVDACLALDAAVTEWNVRGGARGVNLTRVGTDVHADILIQYGNVSKPTMCAETWNQTISINPTPSDACTTYDPAVVLAHELGHAMSGRVHSPVPGALMGHYGTKAPLEEAIKDSDVAFVFGEGAEVE